MTKNMRFLIFHNELSIDLSNYDNPITEIPSVLKFNGGSDLTRIIKLTIESVSVETDTGLFYPINSEKSYSRIGKTAIDIDPANDGELIKLVFINGNKEI